LYHLITNAYRLHDSALVTKIIGYVHKQKKRGVCTSCSLHSSRP